MHAWKNNICAYHVYKDVWWPAEEREFLEWEKGDAHDRKTVRLFISMDFLNHGMLSVGTNRHKFSVYYAVFSVNYSEHWHCDNEVTMVTMHLQLIVNYMTTKVHIVLMSKQCYIFSTDKTFFRSWKFPDVLQFVCYTLWTEWTVVCSLVLAACE